MRVRGWHEKEMDRSLDYRGRLYVVFEAISPSVCLLLLAARSLLAAIRGHCLLPAICVHCRRRAIRAYC